MPEAIADIGQNTTFTGDDRALLEKLSPVLNGKTFLLPMPRKSVNERHRHRAMFAEMMTFFRRTCDLSGKPIITLMNPGKTFPVYSNAEWWGDKWDDLEHGRPFDFQRPFFAQFHELYDLVPKMATFNENSENSEYCSSTGNARNCYYCRTAHRSENIYYSDSLTGYNRDCSDCLRCQRSELLHESIQCLRCHSSTYLFRCTDCVESHFSSMCRNCKQCLFCNNLVNKEYHVENKPVSREQYLSALREVNDGSQRTLERNIARWRDVRKRTVWPALQMVNSDGCTGDALFNCHDCHECYMCFNTVRSRYCWDLTPSEEVSDSMDLTKGGIGELLYNCTSLGGGNYHILCSVKCRKCSEMLYCTDCYTCKNCFGCSGLKNKQYCVLNTQYTKEEYEELVPRIIEHMIKGNEWGEFFPPNMSPFAYNHSLAMYYFPITKEEAKRNGWWWSDYDIHVEAKKSIPAERLPDGIADIPDDVLNWAIICQASGRPFKMIKQELQYLRAMPHPAPREHPDVRMQRRREMLNPYRLWNRPCGKCGEDTESSYALGLPETVYCERCYLETVY